MFPLVFVPFLDFSNCLLLNATVADEEPNTSELEIFGEQLGLKDDALNVVVDFRLCK